MFTRTRRLFLRPGWPEDWSELLAAIADEWIVRNLARAPWPYTPDDAREFASLGYEPRLPNFFVTLPATGDARLIGCAGLSRDGDEVELGYWIAREHWGKGYATEAAQAVVDVARALGHRHLVASHFDDNPASGKVLRKIGFRATGQCVHRFSRGRGEDACAVRYTLDLGECGGPGEAGDEDDGPRMAA